MAPYDKLNTALLTAIKYQQSDRKNRLEGGTGDDKDLLATERRVYVSLAKLPQVEH